MCDARWDFCGRGLVALQHIKKHDVIVDYHGLEVRGVSMEEHLATHPGSVETFCVEVKQHPRRIVDASAEICTKHGDGRRCLVRLSNHAEINHGANMALFDIELPLEGRALVLVAKVDIEPFQQLFWDYKDQRARDLYSGRDRDL